jgi:DNA polymerase-4
MTRPHIFTSTWNRVLRRRSTARRGPRLRGRPVAGRIARVACCRGPRPVYEPGHSACGSAIPMSSANRLCPTPAIVRSGFREYRAASATVVRLFARSTPLWRAFARDAYLDVTQNALNEPLGHVGRQAHQSAHFAMSRGLSASAGWRRTSFGQDRPIGLAQPERLTVMPPSAWNHSPATRVDALGGVGPVTESGCASAGFASSRNVRTATPRCCIGGRQHGRLAAQTGEGEDDRTVEPNRPAKSSSSDGDLRPGI